MPIGHLKVSRVNYRGETVMLKPSSWHAYLFNTTLSITLVCCAHTQQYEPPAAVIQSQHAPLPSEISDGLSSEFDNLMQGLAQINDNAEKIAVINKLSFKAASIVLQNPQLRSQCSTQAQKLLSMLNSIAEEAKQKTNRTLLPPPMALAVSESILDLTYVAVSSSDAMSFRLADYRESIDANFLALRNSEITHANEPNRLKTEDTEEALASRRKSIIGVDIDKAEAGTIIITKYEEYLPKRRKDEWLAKRKLTILSDAEYQKICGTSCKADGFVDKLTGRGFINKDTDPGLTTYHEALHSYSSKDLLIKQVGHPFSEGVTEYLTRKEASARGYDRTNYYDEQSEVVAGLVKLMGRENYLLTAYFGGNVAVLKKAVDKAAEEVDPSSVDKKTGKSFFNDVIAGLNAPDCKPSKGNICTQAQNLVKEILLKKAAKDGTS